MKKPITLPRLVDFPDYEAARKNEVRLRQELASVEAKNEEARTRAREMRSEWDAQVDAVLRGEVVNDADPHAEIKRHEGQRVLLTEAVEKAKRGREAQVAIARRAAAEAAEPHLREIYKVAAGALATLGECDRRRRDLLASTDAGIDPPAPMNLSLFKLDNPQSMGARALASIEEDYGIEVKALHAGLREARRRDAAEAAARRKAEARQAERDEGARRRSVEQTAGAR